MHDTRRCVKRKPTPLRSERAPLRVALKLRCAVIYLSAANTLSFACARPSCVRARHSGSGLRGLVLG